MGKTGGGKQQLNYESQSCSQRLFFLPFSPLPLAVATSILQHQRLLFLRALTAITPVAVINVNHVAA